MINVLIPAKDGARADGHAYADAPNTSEYEFLDGLLEDLPVTVVLPDSLQALLEPNPRFAKYEKQFGKVPDSDREELLALFHLIEEERTFDQSHRRAYEAHKLAQRKAERKSSKRMAEVLFESDKKSLERKGRVRTATDALNVGSVIRVWWDKRNDTLSPGILVDGFRDALKLLLLLNLGNADSIAECGWCHKRFTRSKVAQLFCTLRCGNNARQARLRARKGGTVGTSQTR